MNGSSKSPLSEFQQIVSDIRRERADLEARLARLSRICAETKELMARSRQSIDHSLAILERSPSIVPDAVPVPEPADT